MFLILRLPHVRDVYRHLNAILVFNPFHCLKKKACFFVLLISMRTVCIVYFKWFSHFIDRSKLTQIPNRYTCDVIPFLKTHNNDISTYLVFIIPRLLNFTLKYSRDKSHTRRLLFDCHSTVCTCALHIILSIPHQSSLVNMASNHVHHLDKNLNDCHEHDIDWNLLPQSIREVS